MWSLSPSGFLDERSRLKNDCLRPHNRRCPGPDARGRLGAIPCDVLDELNPAERPYSRHSSLAAPPLHPPFRTSESLRPLSCHVASVAIPIPRMIRLMPSRGCQSGTRS